MENEKTYKGPMMILPDGNGIAGVHPHFGKYEVAPSKAPVSVPHGACSFFAARGCKILNADPDADADTKAADEAAMKAASNGKKGGGKGKTAANGKDADADTKAADGEAGTGGK